MSDDSMLALSSQILDGTRDFGSDHPLNMAREPRLEEVAAGIGFVEAFGNVIAADTGDGIVLIDATSLIHARDVHRAIRGWTDHAIHTAVYTHGHVDHIAVVPRFESEEGAAPVRVIGHEAVAERFDRYDLTNGYNGHINQRQFRLDAPYFPTDFRRPDETYRTELDIEVGDTTFELRHDRGETDDGTWVWLPDRKVLCTGDLFIWASPNCGNPQKAQRYCDEWAVALRKMAALEPELLLPGHGLPIEGAGRTTAALNAAAELLESIFDQTIELMNEGATLNHIIHTVEPPAHLLELPYLRPVYDEPEFVVRNIWRLYGGWYDGNPASLKPAPDEAVGSEIARLCGGAGALADRALELSEAGEHRLAGHLIELATGAAPEDTAVHRTRATVFAARAAHERSTMSIGIFSAARRDSEAHL